MKLAIGSDHAGYELKLKLLEDLDKQGFEVTDFGCYSNEPADFPDISKLVCQNILDGEAERGIMICGSGIGAGIACNKIPGIRAGVCHDIYSAHQCVEHDDVQVLCLGAQVIGHTVALELIISFLKAEFSSDEDIRRRVKKLEQLDGSNKAN